MVYDDFLFQGTGVLAAVWSFHHDPAFWKDPWKWVRLLWLQGDNFCNSVDYRFDPERFAPASKDKIIKMTYMSFGDGPRNCIGRCHI